jgi:hypothetical protein
MHPKKLKPAPRERETGSENVYHCPAIDSSENNSSPSSIQVAHIVSRFKLTAPRAALVARIAFGEVRHA